MSPARVGAGGGGASLGKLPWDVKSHPAANHWAQESELKATQQSSAPGHLAETGN